MKKIARIVLLLLQLGLLLPAAWFAWHVLAPRGYSSSMGERVSVELAAGSFEMLYYPARFARGVLVVASGDGGWSDQWEEPVAQHAAVAGFVVVGWDCRKFADAHGIFDQAQLVAALRAATTAAKERARLPARAPVWYSGWSTGAEWVIAAAATPDRDPQLQGVLAAAPGTRSRYGITAADLLGKQPQGSGSFSLAELAPALAGVSLVQFAAQFDPMDDVIWLQELGAGTPYRLVDIPGAAHDMNRAGPRFLAELDMAVQWIADHPAPSRKSGR